MSPNPITVAVDGSCLGNPGPGGWAWYRNESCWAAGGLEHTTNNVAELTAVREVLGAVPADVPLILAADSRYVIDSLTKWINGWRRRGWTTAAGKPVANKELIVAISELLEGRSVAFRWVRGHAGHTLNEGADRKAHGAALCVRSSNPVRTGPGWSL